MSTIDKIVPLMRRLQAYGVTHFVLSDGLADRFRAHVVDRDTGFFGQASSGRGVLYFRGSRLLTQADLAHLPFDPSPPPAGSARTPQDFIDEFNEASDAPA